MNINIDLPLNIEVTNSQAEFRLGLMFRESLEKDSGMLFIFDSVEQQSFHMKDTQILWILHSLRKMVQLIVLKN